jgi:hypothetical protein
VDCEQEGARRFSFRLTRTDGIKVCLSIGFCQEANRMVV